MTASRLPSHTTASTGSSASTGSWPSTRRPSDARRARIPTPTPARSIRSGPSSGICPDSRARGWTPGRFSFNAKGGRCEACEGEGIKRISMHFPPRPRPARQGGARLHRLPGPAGHDAVGRGGAAREARRRARPPPHGAHPLPARRADHGPARRGRRAPARHPRGPRRARQYRAPRRAQPRRAQAPRLDPRARPGRWRRRRAGRRRRTPEAAAATAGSPTGPHLAEALAHGHGARAAGPTRRSVAG